LRNIPLFIENPKKFIQHNLIIKSDIYKYESLYQEQSLQSEKNSICWMDYYVNFADANLFGFYGTSLFAQDELMTLEHPMFS